MITELDSRVVEMVCYFRFFLNRTKEAIIAIMGTSIKGNSGIVSRDVKTSFLISNNEPFMEMFLGLSGKVSHP